MPQTKRDARKYAEEKGLLRFVDGFVDQVLREQPGDLYEFMLDLASKHTGRQPADQRRPAEAAQPAAKEQLPRPLDKDKVTSFAFTPEQTLKELWQKWQEKHPGGPDKDFLEDMTQKLLDVTVPDQFRQRTISLHLGKKLQTDAQKAAKAAADAPPADVKDGAVKKSKEERDRIERQLLMAAESAVPEKFDASDQVKGQVVKDIDDEDIERGPEKVPYYPRGYHPRKDALSVVGGLRGWHDPKGRLWPDVAISRLVRNCSVMVEHHSNGEPRETVVPLFTYSTFMFSSFVWAVWIASHGAGKWHVLSNKGGWEQCFQTWSRGRSAELFLDEEGAAEVLNRSVQKAKDDGGKAERDEFEEPFVFDDSIEFSADAGMQLLIKDGMPAEAPPGAAPPPEDAFWQGLHVFRGRNCARARRQTMVGGASFLSSSGLSDGPELHRETFVYLSRFCVPDHRLGTSWNPLHDCINWLPMPGNLYKKRPGSGYLAPRRGSYVQMLAGVPAVEHEEDEVADMHNYPPPGVLEYIHSRRSDEVLFRVNAKGDDLFRVCKAETGAEFRQLSEAIFAERNQQQYVAELHSRLKDILMSDDCTDPMQMELLRNLVTLKTGEDFTAASTAKPAALSIAHSIDLQELTWSPPRWAGPPKKWLISFSGKPFGIANDGEGCMPWYRIKNPFEDQPYYHLNASMRNLSFGKDFTALWVNQCKEKRTEGRDVKRFVRQYPENVVGRYATSRPDNVGTGLDLIGACATLNTTIPVASSKKQRLRLDRLKQKAWRMTFHSGTGATVTWVDPVEERWRASAAADMFSDLRAPFEHTVRNSATEFGQWRVHCDTLSVGFLMAHAKTLEQDVVKVETWTSSSGMRRSTYSLTVAEEDTWLDLGTWLLTQSRPLLWQIAQAMASLRPIVNGHRCAPTGNMKLYRGLKDVKLDPKVYAKGKVLLWGQYSSSSRDQGVAQSFAGGPKASVFTLSGRTCRLIAPWSRFGREEEWLFPLNTLWQVTALLTEEQQQILGKSDTQLYEMSEVVSETDMHQLLVRSVLGRAASAAAAGIIFQAEEALSAEGGYLNLALASADEGGSAAKWNTLVFVAHDNSGHCPVQTSNQWEECPHGACEQLCKVVVRGEVPDGGGAEQGEPGVKRVASDPRLAGNKEVLDEVDEGLYTMKTAAGACALKAVAEVLSISFATSLQVTLLSKQSASRFTLKVQSKSEGSSWELLLTLRQSAPRLGNAVRDEGAALLARVLRRGVPLCQIDLTNNGVTRKGAEELLNAVRMNPNVTLLKIVNGSSLSRGTERRAAPLSQLQDSAESFEPDLNDIAQAINIRCLVHDGRISSDRLEAFGPGWPEVAALAVYDCPEVIVDFAGLLSHDLHDQTAHTETFVTSLALKCIRTAEAKKEKTVTFPDLRGALVQAAVMGTPELVELLIEMGSQPTETDKYGETPILKARRRLGKPVQNGVSDRVFDDALVHRLHVAQSLVRSNNAPSDEIDESELETWRVKNLALTAIRLWDEKLAEGYDLVTELISNLVFPNEATTNDKFVILKRIAEKEMMNVRSGRSPLGKTPVDRVGVSLLCFTFVAKKGHEIDALISQAAEECGVQIDPEQGRLGNIDLAVELREAARASFDSQAWGSAEHTLVMRKRLRKWICLWSVLNAILCDGPKLEVPRSKPLRKTLVNMPGGAFASFLKLRQGDIYSISDPAKWYFGVKEPHPGNDTPFTTAFLTMSGRYRGENITALLSKKAVARATCILHPALTSYMVDSHDFDVKTSAVKLHLISRGSLLDSDKELVDWRAGVLKSVEATEIALGISQQHEQDSAYLGRIAAALSRSKVNAEHELARRGMQLDSTRDRRLKTVAESTDERSPSILFVASADNACRARRMVDREAKNISDIVKVSNRFAYWGIKTPRMKAPGVFTCSFQGLHPGKAFPFMKRPACTLLQQIGRTERREAVFQKALLRRIELEKPILDVTETWREIEVSGAKIDEYYWSRIKLGERDEVYADLAKEKGLREHGPPAAEIYGDGVFRIRMGELQQLVRSTQIVTARFLPQLFLRELVRSFTCNDEFSWLFRAMRAVPLNHILDRDLCLVAIKEVLLGHDATERQANSKIEEFTAKMLAAKEVQRTTEDPAAMADAVTAEGVARMRIVMNHQRKANIFEERGLLQKWQEDVLDSVSNTPRASSGMRAIRALEEFAAQCSFAPQWYGFTSRRHVRYVFAKSLVELSTEMCVSQKGYFLTGGTNGCHNQICEKATNPVVFLSSPGLDFCFTMPTVLEANKYFTKKPDTPQHEGWLDFKPNAKGALHQRIRQLYETIFAAARRQGVRNPSMLPLGLGVFLMNLKDNKKLMQSVQKTYFRVQFELLCAEDWGFDNYFLSLDDRGFREMAMKILDNGLLEGGPYNNPADGMKLRCNIVIHQKDAKFLAQELARQDMAPAFLNPSDSQACLLGLLGMFWEVGRGDNYVGEEDWAATSTGTLGAINIAGPAIGLEEVSFRLEGGATLHVSSVMIDGERSGLLCNKSWVNASGEEECDHIGPFRIVEREAGSREILFSNNNAAGEQEEHSFTIQRVKPRVLDHTLRRLEELALSSHCLCRPEGLGTSAIDVRTEAGGRSSSISSAEGLHVWVLSQHDPPGVVHELVQTRLGVPLEAIWIVDAGSGRGRQPSAGPHTPRTGRKPQDGPRGSVNPADIWFILRLPDSADVTEVFRKLRDLGRTVELRAGVPDRRVPWRP